jgi:thioredoxin 1
MKLQEFRDLLLANNKVLLKFSSPTCDPCKKMQKTWDEFIATLTDIKTLQIDATKDIELASIYFVCSVPTVIFFKNGSPAGSLIGLVNKKQLEELIQR